MMALGIVAALVILALLVAAASVRILREYERGVVFTLGRFTGIKGPGLVIVIRRRRLASRRRRNWHSPHPIASPGLALL